VTESSNKACGRILIIEDDANIAGSLVRRLRRDGYEVEVENDGENGARRAVELRPDLVLLDLMLPSRSGLEILKLLHAERLKTIVVTARVDLEDRLRCFELGAADYVPKPFFLDEICARIRARLQSAVVDPHCVIRWADAEVDLDARTVACGDELVPFTRYEFATLAYLLERPGRAVSRAQLAEHAAAFSDPTSARNIDTHIARVRRKLGRAGAAIVTVWGVGYRFDPEAV
jgi:two-component system OmpR family response regulator